MDFPREEMVQAVQVLSSLEQNVPGYIQQMENIANELPDKTQGISAGVAVVEKLRTRANEFTVFAQKLYDIRLVFERAIMEVDESDQQMTVSINQNL